MARATEIAGEIFGRLRGIAKQIVEGDGGIFRELAKEHGEISVLMKRLSSSSDEELRRELFPKIREELLAHTKGEEQEFYPLLENHEPSRALAAQARRDHQEIESILEQLHMSGFGDPSWGHRFEQLVRSVEAHVQMEENQLFPKAKDVMTAREIKESEKRFVLARKRELEALAMPH